VSPNGCNPLLEKKKFPPHFLPYFFCSGVIPASGATSFFTLDYTPHAGVRTGKDSF